MTGRFMAILGNNIVEKNKREGYQNN